MTTSTRDYPSQRLAELGWNSLSESELLALFLSNTISEKQAVQCARKVIDSLSLHISPRELSLADIENAGLSRKRAVSLLAGFKLLRRWNRRVLSPFESFHSSREVFDFFSPLVKGMKRECFWNLLLDGKNRILRMLRVSEGSLTSSIVHPREVFRPAVIEAAAGVLFVHNHPSGEPTPSREDIEITRRLVETGKILGIRVLDHIVIGDYRYFSFTDNGMM
jgi:DNA repair protein RadC